MGTLLAGKIAVITGSAVGIGRGIAVGLAEEGAAVACLDIDGANNAITAAEVRKLGHRALAIDCDVSDRIQVRGAFARIADELGRADVLVNNAATYLNTHLLAGTYMQQTEAWDRSINSCAMSSYYCSAAAAPLMRDGGGGHIINIITEHIKEGHLMTGAPASGYDCAKWVQWRQTESWAVELKPHGIRVNALCPGATDTPMLRAVSVPHAERGMKPADLALAVCNIIRQGPDGPVGQSWLIGPSGSTTGRADVEALANLR